MPVVVLAEGAGPGGHLTIIPIKSISINGNHEHHSVKGTVVHKGPLVSSASHKFILKAVIEDDNSGPQQDSSINMVLLGMLANDFYWNVNQGDVVTASGFTVGKSPTARKDERHPCNLLLSGEQAFVRVSGCPVSERPPAQQVKKNQPLPPAAVSSAPKYTYVKLGDLKPGAVVNVFGVVVFFKQPFKSCGSDLCSSLKLTDQTERKISCTVFCPKMESHPQIFQIGDIVRLHKVKARLYKDSFTLITTFGFSALTFSGMVGADMEPRASGRTFHVTEEDRRIVSELRSWVATQNLLPVNPSVPLSAAQPRMYFTLTCQLLAKATVDSTCTLLRVWDGTRCPHALLKVTVDSNTVEGSASFCEEHEKLIANVLVYDNHVQSAKQLKPGDFLRIFNLRAAQGSLKVPGLSGSASEELNPLSFHLHGGTTYGRGLRLLPDDSPDVRELKRLMEAFWESNKGNRHELDDPAMYEAWSTPSQYPVSEASMEIDAGEEHDAFNQCLERCDPDAELITLGELKRRGPGGVYRVRAQLQSYEPWRLHQALKLHCTACNSMQDVPDDQRVARIFAEASAHPGGPSNPPHWSLSGRVRLPGDDPSARPVDVHLSEWLASQGRRDEFILLTGCTLQEAHLLAAKYRYVVPVTSPPGAPLALLDLSAPFLIRGSKRFYGCKRCSEGAAVREPIANRDGTIDEKVIAQAFGVQLMKFVLLFKLRLQDAGDTLDVFLFSGAESFFNVSAEDAAANQQAQDQIRQRLDTLCPPEGAEGHHAAPEPAAVLVDVRRGRGRARGRAVARPGRPPARRTPRVRRGGAGAAPAQEAASAGARRARGPVRRQRQRLRGLQRGASAAGAGGHPSEQRQAAEEPLLPAGREGVRRLRTTGGRRAAGGRRRAGQRVAHVHGVPQLLHEERVALAAGQHGALGLLGAVSVPAAGPVPRPDRRLAAGGDGVPPCPLLGGGIPGRDHVHPVRPVHRPLPRRRQRALLLPDDGQLGVHRRQAGHHLGRRPAASLARAPHPAAGDRGGARLRRRGRDAASALRGARVHPPAGHALRSGPDVRRRPPLVVLRLLLLPPHALHHLLLAGHRPQDPRRRASGGAGGRRPRHQGAGGPGEPDELRGGGAGHPLWLLPHSREHLQRGAGLHGGGGGAPHPGRPAAAQPDVPLLQGGRRPAAGPVPVPAFPSGLPGLLLLLLRGARRPRGRARGRDRRRAGASVPRPRPRRRRDVGHLRRGGYALLRSKPPLFVDCALSPGQNGSAIAYAGTGDGIWTRAAAPEGLAPVTGAPVG